MARPDDCIQSGLEAATWAQTITAPPPCSPGGFWQKSCVWFLGQKTSLGSDFKPQRDGEMELDAGGRGLNHGCKTLWGSACRLEWNSCSPRPRHRGRSSTGEDVPSAARFCLLAPPFSLFSPRLFCFWWFFLWLCTPWCAQTEGALCWDGGAERPVCVSVCVWWWWWR